MTAGYPPFSRQILPASADLRGAGCIYIRYIMHQGGSDKLLDDVDPHAHDIHRAARNKMFHVAHQLRRAGRVDAVPGHFAGYVLYRLATGRADGRRLVGLLVAAAAALTGPMT